MPEEPEPIDSNDDDSDGEGSNDMKKLRADAKRGRQAEAIERENTILRAGLDPDSEDVQLLVSGLGDDLTPEALTEKATKFGLRSEDGEGGEGGEGDGDPTQPDPNNTPPAGNPVLNEGEGDAIGAAASLSQGATGDQGESKSPFDVALEKANQSMEDGTAERDAVGVGISALIGEALTGNQNVTLGTSGLHRDIT